MWASLAAPSLCVLVASAILAGAVVCTGLSAASPASAPGRLRDLTLSFDARPAYSEWDGVQPGYSCVNGAVDQRKPTKQPSAAFRRDSTPGNVRHGRYAVRVVLNRGDQAPYTCKAEGVAAIKRLNEREGSESWWGWSGKVPQGLAWDATPGDVLFEFTTNAYYWPSYGLVNFDAATRTAFASGSTPASPRIPARSRTMQPTNDGSPCSARAPPGRWSTASGSTSTSTSSGAAGRMGCSRSGTGRRYEQVHEALLERSGRWGPDPGAAASDHALQHANGAPGDDGNPALAGWRLLPRQHPLDERVLVGRDAAQT